MALAELKEEGDESNPFWTRFLQPVQQAEEIAPAIELAIENLDKPKVSAEEEKKFREMEKIRSLDKKLAQATKLQRDLKMALMEKE